MKAGPQPSAHSLWNEAQENAVAAGVVKAHLQVVPAFAEARPAICGTRRCFLLMKNEYTSDHRMNGARNWTPEGTPIESC